jgi:AraC-like DNA-binding protein
MNFFDINPFIRFAEILHYEAIGAITYVRDCRIFYILSGVANICINHQTYTLKPHTIFYCCGGHRYSIASTGIDLIALNFDLTQKHNTEDMPYSPIQLNTNNTLPPCNHDIVVGYEYLNNYLIIPDGMMYYDQLNIILEEFSTQRILYKEKSSGILKTILTQFYRHSIELPNQATQSILKILSYINTNYNKAITNKILSEMTGYHEYHLNRLFLKQTGITIHQYILNIRISEAKKMLLNTDLSLTEIAEKVGFNSNTYFSSYFKQSTGVSPQRFKTIYKNKI